MNQITVRQAAFDYAVDRIRENLTTMPERRDPELLLLQVLSDLGVELAPETNGQKLVRMAAAAGMFANDPQEF